MSSLRGQLVKCFMTLIKYTDIFCLNNERFCTAKASHIFSTKIIDIFDISTFEILKSR